jgi:ABC-type transport system involved in multi-copper enzyme maturation permease subunit
MGAVISFANIRHTAHYERKMLLRSWFFRIFFVLVLLIMALINFGFYIFPQSAIWSLRAVPANIPLLNILFVNLGQAVIAIFLAADFLKRDKKLDTSEVIYTRSISNFEYVSGKTWGVLSVFFGMVVIFSLLALIVNLIVTDTPVIYAAYLFYPLLITLPTLVFILGLSYLVMNLFRNQAVTFLILIGFVALTLFYLKTKYFGVFDYMGFYTPMIYSDLNGFTDLYGLIVHRAIYFLLGSAFIFVTIAGFGRLPNTRFSPKIHALSALVLFILAVFAVLIHIDNERNLLKNTQLYIDLNTKYALHPTVDVLNNRLQFSQDNDKITLKSHISAMYNRDEPGDTLVFLLNPGLMVNSLTDNDGSPIHFERQKQLILVVPQTPLTLGDSLQLHFHISGVIDPSISYIDIPEVEKRRVRTSGPLHVNSRYAFVSDEYVLLTPESMWYPVAGVGFNSKTLKSIQSDFSTYSLDVNHAPGMTVVSQGESLNGVSNTFIEPGFAYKGLTLIVGKYDTLSVKVDSIEYVLYLKEGHDYFSEYLPNIKDTLPSLIRYEMNRYENNSLGIKYPYKRMSFVEVPATYRFFQRLIENNFDAIQPGIVLVPERGFGLNMADFPRYVGYDKKRSAGKVRDADIEAGAFRRFAARTFLFSNASIRATSDGPGSSNDNPLYMGGVEFSMNPYCIFPMYLNHLVAIESTEYPLLEMIISNYFREGFAYSGFTRMSGGMREPEKANFLLKDKTFEEIVTDPANKSLLPNVISQKGAYFLYGLKFGIGAENFDQFIREYIAENRFNVTTAEDLQTAISNEFDVDIEPYLKLVGYSGSIPSFLLGEPLLVETRDDIGPVYLIRLKISNVSDINGLINISIRVSGRGWSGAPEERNYEFLPNETKEIQIMLYDQPRMVTVNTLISQNIPSSFNLFLRSAVKNRRIIPEEYEITVDDVVFTIDQNEIVVDNEDSGFVMVQQNTETKVKQYINSLRVQETDKYKAISSSYPPHTWVSIAHTAFHGQIIRSAYYTRKGAGERTATWNTQLEEEGLYDVYVYIPRDAMMGMGDSRGRSSRSSSSSSGGSGRGGPSFLDERTDYQYFIHTGNGVEEVQYRLYNTVNGWNKLGSFYFNSGDVSVELTNKTNGNRVFADAVKWVKRN